MRQRQLPSSAHQASIIALLLVQLFVRTHHITAQDPYIDEGFHIVRAAQVWDFDVNPGRLSHGKVLLYFWLGLFGPDPAHSLAVSRLAIALFSLLSSAAIYAVGRQLYNRRTGVVALGLYAVLPLAAFYERMAMADPFASGFVALVAWRSLVFARRPAWREGIMLGVLLACATLAKLTTGLFPALPVIAALLTFPWRRGSLGVQGWRWLKTYVPPLILAAGVMALIWIPLVIPAYLSQKTDHPYTLVDDYNLRSSDEKPYQVDAYIERILDLIEDFTGAGLLVAVGGAVVGHLLLWGVWRRPSLRGLAVVLAWLALVVVLPIFVARLATARYFMPLAAPGVLILAGVSGGLWEVPRLRAPARALVVIGLGTWLVFFAGPFLRTDLTHPGDLPLHGTNWTEYTSGYLSADEAVREAAAHLNALALSPEQHIYANWNLCHLLFLYSEHPVECLELNQVKGSLIRHLNTEMAPGEAALVLLRGYSPFFDDISGICSAELARFASTLIDRPVTIWQVQRTPC